MSKVEIEISDDRWFRGEWDFRPLDKQLCVVIFNKVIQIPLICLFLEKDCVFLDIHSIKKRCSKTDKHEEKTVSYITMDWSGVDRWKPLGLPVDVNERVLEGAKKLCEVIDIK